MVTGPAHKVRINSVEAKHFPDHKYPDGTTAPIVSVHMSVTVDGKMHRIVRMGRNVVGLIEDTRDRLEVMGIDGFRHSMAVPGPDVQNEGPF